jgi:hypothetical protein
MLEFWGALVPQPLLNDIEALMGRLDSKSRPAAGLGELLTDQEIGTLLRRVEVILRDPVIPRLDPRLNVPWPLV